MLFNLFRQAATIRTHHVESIRKQLLLLCYKVKRIKKTTLLYNVLIHFKTVITFLLDGGPSYSAVQKHVWGMWFDHRQAPLSSLDHIRFLTQLSLLLLQALTWSYNLDTTMSMVLDRSLSLS
jgi:hypothetical protein